MNKKSKCQYCGKKLNKNDNSLMILFQINVEERTNIDKIDINTCTSCRSEIGTAGLLSNLI